jgi:predicted nucleic acid-binding protein
MRSEIYYVTKEDVLAAWEVFRRFRDKDWSFTDCVSYAVMQRLQITTAFSFDHHFTQFGTITVVP